MGKIHAPVDLPRYRLTTKPLPGNLPGVTAHSLSCGEPATEKLSNREDCRHAREMPPVRPQVPSAARSVSVRGDTVVKIQEPGASRRERLRTLAGREVGRRTGLFVVPEILSFDDAGGQIVFERLSLTWLREAISDPSRSIELVGRAAAALAAIHGHMESTEGATVASPAGTRPVPLHGDFGMRNVFHLPDSDDIAIIDWSNADWIGFDADLGPPEVDVAVFLMSLFHRRAFGPWPISRRHDVARHFLATYSSASPYGLDLDFLGEVVAASTPSFNRQTRRRKGALRALGYRYNMLDLHLFLRRLSGQRFAGPRDRRTG
jgi:hypothetical protein